MKNKQTSGKHTFAGFISRAMEKSAAEYATAWAQRTLNLRGASYVVLDNGTIVILQSGHLNQLELDDHVANLAPLKSFAEYDMTTFHQPKHVRERDRKHNQEYLETLEMEEKDTSKDAAERVTAYYHVRCYRKILALFAQLKPLACSRKNVNHGNHGNHVGTLDDGSFAVFWIHMPAIVSVMNAQTCKSVKGAMALAENAYRLDYHSPRLAYVHLQAKDAMMLFGGKMIL